MKKLLTIAALAATASLSFGQGFVSFFNTSGQRVSTNSVPSANGGSGPAVLAGGAVNSFYYALLVAPTTQTTVDASYTGWTFSGSYATNTATAGRVNGANNADGVGNVVNGYGPTATANFVIVGWSSNIGATWAQALAFWNNGNVTGGSGLQSGTVGYFGTSVVALNIPLAPSGGPYNNVFGATAVPNLTLGAFTVPEPSTFALAGLGAAALLIFRRRK